MSVFKKMYLSVSIMFVCVLHSMDNSTIQNSRMQIQRSTQTNEHYHVFSRQQPMERNKIEPQKIEAGIHAIDVHVVIDAPIAEEIYVAAVRPSRKCCSISKVTCCCYCLQCSDQGALLQYAQLCTMCCAAVICWPCVLLQYCSTGGERNWMGGHYS